jgi:SAM-dependent methyltransferase
MLPPSVDGLDVIELGCGTAYVSSWLARRGARPVGIDNSPAQLETARRLQAEFGVEFPLHQGNAEQTPFPDESFDLAISEYGASIWCDPYLWIPEAARILRPGGQLVFLVNGAILMLCAPDAEDEPATDRLLRDYFGMHRFEWPRRPVRRVPSRLRRHDPTAAPLRIRGGGHDRGAPAGGRDDELSLRAGGVGAPVAGGRGLESPEANAIAGGAGERATDSSGPCPTVAVLAPRPAPRGRVCGCPSDCWCQRSGVGRLFRWVGATPISQARIAGMEAPARAGQRGDAVSDL